MQTVRVTQRPTEDLEVPDDEVPVLRALGILIEDTRATTDAGLEKAAANQVAKNAKNAKNAGADNTPEV